MTDSQRRFDRLATKHGLVPRYLREIVYLSAAGYHQHHICEKTGFSESTVSKYRRKLREMDDDTAAEIFRLVAEIKNWETIQPEEPEAEPVEG